MKTSIVGSTLACIVIVSLVGAMLNGCSGADESEGCVFDGRYEMGFLAYESPLDCSSTSFTIFGEGEDECSTDIDQFGQSGAHQIGYISCEPGDPIVGCEGYMSDSDGCQWQLYLRRVSP